MLRIVLIVTAAAAVGAVFGYFGQCSSGACPLTATWWRGGLYGATMGLLLALAMKG